MPSRRGAVSYARRAGRSARYCTKPGGCRPMITLRPSFTQECSEKYEELSRQWESRLDALYQAATPPRDAYRYWFGEVGRDASDTMRQIARQNGSLKLHEALQARIQGSEWPAEMRDLLAWSQQTAAPSGSSDLQGEGTASQGRQHGHEGTSFQDHSSAEDLQDPAPRQCDSVGQHPSEDFAQAAMSAGFLPAANDGGAAQ